MWIVSVKLVCVSMCLCLNVLLVPWAGGMRIPNVSNTSSQQCCYKRKTRKSHSCMNILHGDQPGIPSALLLPFHAGYLAEGSWAGLDLGGGYAGLDLGEGLNLALSVFSAGIHIRGIPRMCFWF